MAPPRKTQEQQNGLQSDEKAPVSERTSPDALLSIGFSSAHTLKLPGRIGASHSTNRHTVRSREGVPFNIEMDLMSFPLLLGGRGLASSRNFFPPESPSPWASDPCVPFSSQRFSSPITPMISGCAHVFSDWCNCEHAGIPRSDGSISARGVDVFGRRSEM